MTRHVLVILLVTVLGLPVQAAPSNDSTHWLADESQAERIRRVERGLPAVALPDGQKLQLDLAQWMEFFKIPGMSVAVFDNFHLVWMKAYGVREVGSSRPVTLDTTFQAGSISKPLTAMAVMHYVQAGKLSLDANVNDQLRSWKVPENEFTAREKVTLRRLLSHSAGTNVFRGYVVGEPVPTTLQVLNGEKPATTPPVRVEMVPGTRFEYSGGGITVVQLLLVDSFKKPFPQLMDETVIHPLGLKHSSYEQPQPPARAALAATGHLTDGKPVEGKWHIFPEMAAAGLWTTAGDLAEVFLEVAKSKHGHSNRVLTQASTRTMLTVQAPPDLGLGFFLGPGRDQFGHQGFDPGFFSKVVAFSDTGSGVAIMTNSSAGIAIFDPLMASVAKEYSWRDYTPEPTSLFVRCVIVSKRLGAERAVSDYASQRARGPKESFGPDPLNDCGYALLSAGQTEAAIRMLEANVAFYPEDANSYDSLGEAYMTAGNTALAIKNYEQSLKLDPKNSNAVQMLARMGVTWSRDGGAK
jgi:CubicO group peptidase (beta-lactamase class C family)